MKTTNLMKKRNTFVPVLLAGIIAVTGFATTTFSASASTISEYDMSQEPSYRRLDTLNYDTSAASTLSTKSVGVDMSYTMSDTDWGKIYRAALTADIVVTKDYVTLGVDHGHSALMASGNTTVEHYGPRNENVPGATGFSDEYSFANLWKHTKTCRVYGYDGITSGQRSSIAKYARENLRGWEYYANADRTDNTKMNCATLVWKAYNSIGLTLNGYWNNILSFTMLPSDFVEQNPDLSMKASVGWTSGEHNWK